MKYLCLLLLVASPAWACQGVEVTQGWVREAPPGADVMAGYASFKNTGSKSRTLRTFVSPQFSSVEVHEMRMAKGEMQMRELPRLRLPPYSTIQLEPGGMHLMLFTPLKPLKAGDVVELSVDCGSRPPLQFKLPVKQAE